MSELKDSTSANLTAKGRNQQSVMLIRDPLKRVPGHSLVVAQARSVRLGRAAASAGRGRRPYPGGSRAALG
eukprot:1265756-Pleurochrysis_carterae.AAC.1